MFIFAGKTLNIYEMKPQDYEKLIMKNHHNASNQKAPDTFENGINIEVKNIAKLYKLAVGTDHLQRKETFIALKDHDDNFYNKPSCPLINPTKNEL